MIASRAGSVSGASRVRPFFGGVNVRVLALKLLHNQDARTIEIDVRATERVQLARAEAGERGDLEPCGKRRVRQLACAANQLPDLLLLARRLLVTTTLEPASARPPA